MRISDTISGAPESRSTHKIFNNWDVVTLGWYRAMDAKSLKRGEVKSVELCGQRIALWRGQSGKVYAMDAYCPHMGVDLGIGSVKGEYVRCFFHHWQFDGKANCKKIPCGEDAPKNLKKLSYATREKYGQIWLWPSAETEEDVLEVPELEGQELVYKKGRSFPRKCHYHITMINGIDPQHLKTVHNIHIDMDVDINETSRNHIHITLKGKFPNTTLTERIGKFLLGENYSYAMKYADGCLAALTIMKDAKLFGVIPLPELHMLFAYTPISGKRSLVTPIYVNKKRSTLVNHLLLWFTKRCFFMLQGEDGDIYENIKFNSRSLLKIDAPVAKYIGYINRLGASIWSRKLPEIQ